MNFFNLTKHLTPQTQTQNTTTNHHHWTRDDDTRYIQLHTPHSLSFRARVFVHHICIDPILYQYHVWSVQLYSTGTPGHCFTSNYTCVQCLCRLDTRRMPYYTPKNWRCMCTLWCHNIVWRMLNLKQAAAFVFYRYYRAQKLKECGVCSCI